MADLRTGENVGADKDEDEERLLDRVATLDFDDLCSTVATQNHGKWRLLDSRHFGEEDGVEGVSRMWEGEVFDCFDDRHSALESLCCPWCRFGKNTRQAGIGYYFIQGNESFLDDYVYHLISSCCAISQETRTLEMNNVQGGTWHGRGDTVCVGTIGEGGKSFVELHPPPKVSVRFYEPGETAEGRVDIIGKC